MFRPLFDTNGQVLRVTRRGTGDEEPASVTVIWASQRLGYPHTQNASDMGIPGGDAQNIGCFNVAFKNLAVCDLRTFALIVCAQRYCAGNATVICHALLRALVTLKFF